MSQLLNRDPVSPRLLNPAIPRDLETICLKCLEKEPARRYATAGQLAEELGRCLRDEPILARPAGTPEKVWRWCRRQPVLAGLLVVVALALVGVAIVSSVAARRVTRSAKLVEKERASVVQANRDLGASVQRLELQLAEERFRADDVGGGLAFLAAVVRRDPSNHIAMQRLFSALLHRNFPLPVAPPITGLGRVWNVEFSADGKRLLVLWEPTSAQGRQSFVRIWDAATSQPLTAPLENAGLVLRAHFSPDGRFLLTASADQTARVWDGLTGAPVTPMLKHGGAILAVRFSPDSTRFLTITSERKARLWESATGRLLNVWLVHSTTPVDARFSPDGQLVATAQDNQLAIRAHGGVRLENQTSLNFGNQTRQMLNLWSDWYGIGVQNQVMYFRTAGHRGAAPIAGASSFDWGDGFAWYSGGSHSDTVYEPGNGGEVLMTLTKGTYRYLGCNLGDLYYAPGAVLRVRGEANVDGNIYTTCVFGVSDRNAKENFQEVNEREVLEKVSALPITRWNYKKDKCAAHIGPVAQDFYAAFGLGVDDKHIATVDEGGVALAAIQGLNQKLEESLTERDARIAELEKTVSELKSLLPRL